MTDAVNITDRSATSLRNILYNKVKYHSLYFMKMVKLMFIMVLRLIIECKPKKILHH